MKKIYVSYYVWNTMMNQGYTAQSLEDMGIFLGVE